MAGTKRANNTDAREGTRSNKVARTTSKGGEKTTRRTRGNSKKTKSKALPRSTFQGEALPIHVHFTHTPPAVFDTDGEQNTSKDPGHIGNLTILPIDFSTGSYGWKGASKLTLELQGGSEGEEKQKVQVMINVNATVVGSKETIEEAEVNNEDEYAEGKVSEEEEATTTKDLHDTADKDEEN